MGVFVCDVESANARPFSRLETAFSKEFCVIGCGSADVLEAAEAPA
jgi:hypothetical protein